MLSRTELFARICVRDPYFALEEVAEAGPGSVTARVPVELEPGAEEGPMSAAEAGRHLAILGSCAASRVNPREGRHFYLAHQARLERLTPHAVQAGASLLGRAEARFTDRRTAVARTRLEAPWGEPLFALEVSYRVLTEAAFERLFDGARVEMRARPRVERAASAEELLALRRNPYRQSLPLSGLTASETEGAGTLAAVDSSHCLGHFPLYPVLPVAVVMSGLAQVAGAVMRQRMGQPQARYRVRAGQVQAENLALAGEPVTFTARHLAPLGRAEAFHCLATARGGKRIGEMTLELEPSLERPGPARWREQPSLAH